MNTPNRRRILRGALQGGAVTVALPLLNCFLDGNGAALASGRPLPVRFGTWFWGLGMNKAIFIPKTVGANYDLPDEIAALAPVRQHLNIFTNYRVIRDANPNLCHFTGWVALRSGMVPSGRGDLPGESIDVTVAQLTGGGTRFRSLDANATGDARDSYSFRGANAVNPPEISPIEFYQRVFGADFQDPNSSNFTPSARVMMQQSVLSGVLEESKDLNRSLGVEDRARLDQYFSGLRDVERQLEHQLEKPAPIAACVKPGAPTEEIPAGLEVALVAKRHTLMTKIMVMAVACGQTNVFNMTYANSFAATVKPGYDKGHHTATHEEMIDEKLGYQPQSSWFTKQAMASWAEYVAAFAAVPEGDGTLLDNMLIYAHSDQELAKIHSIEGIPMFTAGKAGGKLKTGIHVAGAGQPGTQLGYTLLRVMGADVQSWGSQSNQTSKEIGEILV
jgi:hypothetical protein